MTRAFTLSRSFAGDSDHWYDRRGNPQHTVIAKGTGEPRPTTLRDARALLLVPSVTKVTGCAARPGLENWKGEQLILASLTLQRSADETDKEWIARIRADAGEQPSKAADFGTAIHAAIRKRLASEPVDPDMLPYADGALRAIEPLCLDNIRTERSFASRLGFGGAVDLHTADMVIDFKSKDGDLKDVACWPEHWMQCAAYARGLGIPGAACANVFVSRTHRNPDGSAIARVVHHNRSDTERGWRMFVALLTYWQEAHDYRSSWTEDAAAVEATA